MTQTSFDYSNLSGRVGQLAESLPDHRLVNLSFNGGRVTDLLDRQLPAMESLDAEPDLVTVITI